MNKIYLIMGGEYSDTYIVGYFSSLKEAEEYVTFKNDRYDELYIEEVEEINLSKEKEETYYCYTYKYNSTKEEIRYYMSNVTDYKDDKIWKDWLTDTCYYIKVSFKEKKENEFIEKVVRDRIAKFNYMVMNDGLSSKEAMELINKEI